MYNVYSFNPRTHMGCDQTLETHSLTDTSFNPRTHMGCDFHLHIKIERTISFNPRTHMGCDSINPLL